MKTEVTVGIDFGTSKSAISWRRADTGEVRIVRIGTESSMPSLVYYGDDGEILVGGAVEALLDDDEAGALIVRTAKRDLATDLIYPVPTDPTPVSTVTRILRALLDAAEADPELAACLGPDKRVTEATITHPATFSALHKQRLLEAAYAAKLQNVRLRTEPMAAALAAADAIKKGLGKTVMVYDLGAGTFDLAVLTRDGDGRWRQVIEPIGERIGGDDFDNLVYDHAEQKAIAYLGCRLNEAGGRSPRLLNSYRKRKENLSNPNVSTVPLSDVLPNGKRLKHDLTRDEFERIIHGKIEETIVFVQKALRSAYDEKAPVDSVILIGGSSRIPLVEKMLTKYANVAHWGERGLAVVRGACLPYEEKVQPPPPPPPKEASTQAPILVTVGDFPPEMRADLERLNESLKKGGASITGPRRPVIVVGGRTGVGKSTTINRIFGRVVSRVGTGSRGTELPRELVWQFTADGKHDKIDQASLLLIDLPGLGDAKRELEIEQIRPKYREYAPKADCILLIVTPPRPSEASVIDAIRLLLAGGAKAEQIVFGVNLHPELNYHFNKKTQKVVSDSEFDKLPDAVKKSDIELRKVSPSDFDDKLSQADNDALNAMIREFLRVVNEELAPDFGASFGASQVVVYDGQKGWHIFQLLEVIASRLPKDALLMFIKETKKVADAIYHDYEVVKKAAREEQEAKEREERAKLEAQVAAAQKLKDELAEAETRRRIREAEERAETLRRRYERDRIEDDRKYERIQQEQVRYEKPLLVKAVEWVADKWDRFKKWAKGG